MYIINKYEVLLLFTIMFHQDPLKAQPEHIEHQHLLIILGLSNSILLHLFKIQ